MTLLAVLAVSLDCNWASKALRGVTGVQRRLRLRVLARRLWMAIAGVCAAARTLDELPAFILLENSEGVVTMCEGEALRLLMGALTTLPYRWAPSVIQAARDLKAAQRRTRFFLAGVCRAVLDDKECGDRGQTEEGATETRARD